MALEALEHHQVMFQVFNTFNYEILRNLDDSYLDAPVPTEVFLKSMQRLGANKWQLLDESHGAMLLEKPQLKGTSYVTGMFYKPDEI